MPSSGAQAQDAAMGYGRPTTSADRVTALSWPFSSTPSTELGNHPYTTLENPKKDDDDVISVSFIPALYFMGTMSSIKSASKHPLAKEEAEIASRKCRGLHLQLDISSLNPKP